MQTNTSVQNKSNEQIVYLAAIVALTAILYLTC